MHGNYKLMHSRDIIIFLLNYDFQIPLNYCASIKNNPYKNVNT